MNNVLNFIFIYPEIEIFCDIVEGLEEACLENNILDIWNYKKEVISKLSRQDIINAINSVERSNLTRVPYSNLIGQVSFFSLLGFLIVRLYLICVVFCTALSRVTTNRDISSELVRYSCNCSPVSTTH